MRNEDTNICGKPAYATVGFPTGRQVVCCLDCTNRAHNIMAVLGAVVYLQPCDPADTCQQKTTRKQADSFASSEGA